MSFIDTDGRSSRFLTRAQNWAITIESAPRSSKKWLSTGTRSTCMMSGQHLGEASLAFGGGQSPAGAAGTSGRAPSPGS